MENNILAPDHVAVAREGFCPDPSFVRDEFLSSLILVIERILDLLDIESSEFICSLYSDDVRVELLLRLCVVNLSQVRSLVEDVD